MRVGFWRSAVVLTVFLAACRHNPPSGTTATTAASVADETQEVDLAPDTTPTWPAPKVTPDRPIPMRVARTDGEDVAWAYGGEDARGLAVRMQWRDADGAIVSSSTHTGGFIKPKAGWWAYSELEMMKFDTAPTQPVSAEAEAYEITYKDGRRWSSPSFGWRYTSTKPTIVDKNIGIEVTAIEKEWWFHKFQGKLCLEVYNMGQTPFKRVDLECEIHDRSGAVVATITPAWVPTIGDHPIPELLPGVHAQVEQTHHFKDDAESAVWSKKNGLTATCKVTSHE